MKHSKKTYTTFHFLSSIFMSVLLLCLTSSLFFVPAENLKSNDSPPLSILIEHNDCDNTDLADTSKLGTPEEKPESSVNSVSEYLTVHARLIFSLSMSKELNKYKHADLYVAFHGELISPPPEV